MVVRLRSRGHADRRYAVRPDRRSDTGRRAPGETYRVGAARHQCARWPHRRGRCDVEELELGPREGSPSGGVDAAAIDTASGDTAVPAATGHRWVVEVDDEGAVFDRLAEEWDDLHRRCPEATPFQAHAWLAAWWRHYGTRRRLVLLTVRHDGDLVAAVPLFRESRTAGRVLTLVGGGQSDYGDILVDGEPDRRSQALDAIVHALRAMAGWWVVDALDVPPGAVFEALAGRWPAATVALPADVCLELPTTDFGTLLASLPQRRRKQVRKQLREIEGLAVSREVVAVDAVTEAASQLLELHGRQWEGRGGYAEHFTPRFRSFFLEAAGRLVRDGHAELHRYTLDGSTSLASLVVHSPRVAGAYLFGAAPELRAKLDITSLVTPDELDAAVRHGAVTYSMMRGDEPYKRRWRPEPVQNRRLLLARRAALARGYATALRTRAQLRTVRERQDRTGP